MLPHIFILHPSFRFFSNLLNLWTVSFIASLSQSEIDSHEIFHCWVIPYFIAALCWMCFCSLMLEIDKTSPWHTILSCDTVTVLFSCLLPQFLMYLFMHSPSLCMFHWFSPSIRISLSPCLNAVVEDCFLLTHWLNWQLCLVESLAFDIATSVLSAL